VLASGAASKSSHSTEACYRPGAVTISIFVLAMAVAPHAAATGPPALVIFAAATLDEVDGLRPRTWSVSA